MVENFSQMCLKLAKFNITVIVEIDEKILKYCINKRRVIFFSFIRQKLDFMCNFWILLLSTFGGVIAFDKSLEFIHLRFNNYFVINSLNTIKYKC